MKKPLFRGTLVRLLTILLSSCSPSGKEPRTLPLERIRVGKREVEVEVARKMGAIARGLMFRKGLPEDGGMLFVFRREGIRRFWMKNTRIPLSIAFIRADGSIASIRSMAPYGTSPVASTVPVKYALEMNAGWFERNGVKVGDRVEGIGNHEGE